VRRATAALLGTVVGTTLLVGAKYASTPPAAPVSAPVDPLADGAPADPTGGPDAGSAPATAPGTGPSGGAPPTAGPRTPPSAGARTTASPPPPPPGGSCSTVTGNAANVARPGTGAVTVTIKVCGGSVSTAHGTLSRSNWGRNSAALPALDGMAVRYYKTDISQLHYSGATLTGNAYQASLRSALGKAGI